MNLLAQAFWLPKAGSTIAEYEDDFDFTHNRKVRRRREGGICYSGGHYRMAWPRFAVADGATESSFSGLWAHQLAELYVAKGPRQATTLRKWVEWASQAWFAELAQLDLPWFAARKAQKGAFSTLVGLSILPGEGSSGRWCALIAGDSCLFQIRGSELVAGLPATTSDDLEHSPLLLSSRPERNVSIWREPENLQYGGTWEIGDCFLLMTDALAHWFLRGVESGVRPWIPLADLASASQIDRGAFGAWVEDLRKTGDIRNDDVTLLTAMPY